MCSSGMLSLRATRIAHSASRVLCTPVLMSLRSKSWLKAHTRELRNADCCSSSSFTRKSSNPESANGVLRLALISEYSVTSFHRRVGIQASPTQLRVEDGIGVRKSGGDLRRRASAVLAEHQGSRSSDERSTKRSSPARGIRSRGIQGHDAFARRRHEHRRIAIVRERGLNVLI